MIEIKLKKKLNYLELTNIINKVMFFLKGLI